jgi:hypothetical protein
VTVPSCPAGEDARAWIEARAGWILEAFAHKPPEKVEVVLPTEHYFPEGFDGSADAAFGVFARVRGYLDLETEHMVFRLFEGREDVFNQPEWQANEGHSACAAGLFVKGIDGEPHLVELSTSQLSGAGSTVATVAHELCHVLLIGQGRITSAVPDHEPLTDLLTVFLGLGVFTANSVIHETNWSDGNMYGWSVGRLGYMRQEEYAYALALFARLRGEDDPVWAEALCHDVKTWFGECTRFLKATGWDEPDAYAQRRKAIQTTESEFAALRRRAEDEAPQGSSGLKTALFLVLAPLVVCLLFALGPAWLDARQRPLHVVNATSWVATVQVDGASPVSVAPGKRRALPIGDGRHQVRVTTERGESTHEVVMETAWGDRGGRRQPVFVLNVLGAAMLERSGVHYGTLGAPRYEFESGEWLVAFEKIDYAFVTPPVSLPVGPEGEVRDRVRWISGQPFEILSQVDQVIAPADALRFLDAHLRLRPDDLQLLLAREQWTARRDAKAHPSGRR